MPVVMCRPCAGPRAVAAAAAAEAAVPRSAAEARAGLGGGTGSGGEARMRGVDGGGSSRSWGGGGGGGGGSGWVGAGGGGYGPLDTSNLLRDDWGDPDARPQWVGTDGWCLPRHHTHFEPSSLELNGIQRRGELDPLVPTSGTATTPHHSSLPPTMVTKP